MQNVLITDTETDGTHEGAVCIEVAAILYDVNHGAAIRSFASLIRAESNAAEPVNRIPATMLADAPTPDTVWPFILKMASKAEAICAHGADFDRRFVHPFLLDKPWICTMNDLTWPRAQKPGESLVKLALAHDLGVSYAHRALADCDLLARLLTRVREMGADLQAFLARGLRPKALFVVADRSFDPERNAKCKLAGFGWDKPEAPRQWSRRMAIEDAPALPFAVQQVAA